MHSCAKRCTTSCVATPSTYKVLPNACYCASRVMAATAAVTIGSCDFNTSCNRTSAMHWSVTSVQIPATKCSLRYTWLTSISSVQCQCERCDLVNSETSPGAQCVLVHAPSHCRSMNVAPRQNDTIVKSLTGGTMTSRAL